MSTKEYLRCPPFCYVDCSLQHHPLIIALINIDPNSPATDFPVLDGLISKYEKQGNWRRTSAIPDANPEYRFPLLHWSAILGLIGVMKWLFHKKKCLVPENDNKDPILHKVIDFLHENTRFSFNELMHIVKEILDCFGSHLLVKDQDGNTPMHLCCLAFQTPLPRLKQTYYLNWTYSISSRHQKDPLIFKSDALLVTQNKNGETPLHILAKHNDNYNLLKSLIDGSSLVKGHGCAVDLLIRNKENMTVLDVATVNGNVKVCTLLSKYCKTDKEEKESESVSHATRFSRHQSALIKKITTKGDKETPEKKNTSITLQRNRKHSSSQNDSLRDDNLDENPCTNQPLEKNTGSIDKVTTCSNSPQLVTCCGKSQKNMASSKGSKKTPSKTGANDCAPEHCTTSSVKTVLNNTQKTHGKKKKNSSSDQVDKQMVDNSDLVQFNPANAPDSRFTKQIECKIRRFSDFIKESIESVDTGKKQDSVSKLSDDINDRVDFKNKSRKRKIYKNSTKCKVYDNKSDKGNYSDAVNTDGKASGDVSHDESLYDSDISNLSLENVGEVDSNINTGPVTQSPAIPNRLYYAIDGNDVKIATSGASDSDVKNHTVLPPTKSPNRLYYGLDGDDVKITGFQGRPAVNIVQDRASIMSHKGIRKGTIKIPRSTSGSPVGVVQLGRISLSGTDTTSSTTTNISPRCRLVPTNIVIGGQGTKMKKVASIPGSKSLPTNISALARASLMAYLKKISQGKTVVDLTVESTENQNTGVTSSSVSGSEMDQSQSVMYVIPASEAQNFLSVPKVEIPDEKGKENLNDSYPSILDIGKGNPEGAENFNVMEHGALQIKTEPTDHKNDNISSENNQNALHSSTSASCVDLSTLSASAMEDPSFASIPVEESSYSLSNQNQVSSVPGLVDSSLSSVAALVDSSKSSVLVDSSESPVLVDSSESRTPVVVESSESRTPESSGRKRKGYMSDECGTETPAKFIKMEQDLQFTEEVAFNQRSPSPVDSVHDTNSTTSELSTNITDEPITHKPLPTPTVFTSPSQLNSSLPITSRYNSETLPSPSGYSSTGSTTSEPDRCGKGIMSYLSVCSDSSRQEFLETLMRDRVKYTQDKEELQKQYQDACTRCDKKIEETKFKNSSLKYYLKKVMDIQKDLYKLSKETNEITELKNQIASRKDTVDKKLETCENAVAEFKNMLL